MDVYLDKARPSYTFKADLFYHYGNVVEFYPELLFLYKTVTLSCTVIYQHTVIFSL